MPRPLILVLSASPLLVACAGESETDLQQELDVYACGVTTQGTLLDGSATRAAAREAPVGRDPVRVNLLQDQANFVTINADDDVTVTLFLDHPGALTAVWSGETRTEVTNSVTNEFCPGSIPERLVTPLGKGLHHLELGPVEQAAVWLLVGDPSA
ncbi:MAG: hypothetical protein KTR31_21780 [Myxococcales bacterium]|nr:hypothetical protein [Myxococcales bacterium]